MYTAGGVDLAFAEEQKVLLGVVVQLDEGGPGFAQFNVFVEHVVELGPGQVITFFDDVDVRQ